MASIDNNRDDQLEGDMIKFAASPSKAGNVTHYAVGKWSKPEATSTLSGNPLQSRQNETEYASSFHLVQKASEAIDLLQERCRRLEANVRDNNDRFKSEAESSERVIKDWERLAGALKDQLSKTEASLAEAQHTAKALEERAAVAEARAEQLEKRLQISENRAEEAEARAKAAEQLASQESELASSFRDSIREAFGKGSRLSSALAGEFGS